MPNNLIRKNNEGAIVPKPKELNQRINKKSRRARRDRRDSQFNKPRVAILGDSMLKHLNTKRMQNELSKQKINIKTSPGAGIDQMKHYVVPTLNTKPNKLISHIGTNDLHNKTPDNLLKSINNLGQTITQQSKDTSLMSSEIITGTDNVNLTEKVSVVKLIVA